MTVMSINEYISAHRERFMNEWASLIRIPSVSCQAGHKADMLRCAERWRELLSEAGCHRAEVLPSLLHAAVQEELPPGRPEGRLRVALSEGRLAHAQRRDRRHVARGSGGGGLGA